MTAIPVKDSPKPREILPGSDPEPEAPAKKKTTKKTAKAKE